MERSTDALFILNIFHHDIKTKTSGIEYNNITQPGSKKWSTSQHLKFNIFILYTFDRFCSKIVCLFGNIIDYSCGCLLYMNFYRKLSKLFDIK